jgi:predicted deacylase
MKRIEHPLLVESLGSQRSLSSWHFEPEAGITLTGPTVYLQASLHAEELPGMLALHHLIAMLTQAELAGHLRGRVVVVPVANPIGLSQRVDHKPMGRFELASSENFNRHYPDLCQALWPVVKDKLGPDAQHNVQLIRRAAQDYLAAWQAPTQLQSLRKTLLSLAVQADVVLDLHCDCEAVMHLYAEEPCAATLLPLAQWLGARAVLISHGSGGLCFDECLSGLWWQLAALASQLPTPVPVPQACASTTVELRGEGDVSHAYAMADANALMAYLQSLGVVRQGDAPAPVPPALQCEPTPLAGAQLVRTPVPGIVVFAAEVGQELKKGDLVAEIINPLAVAQAQTTRIYAEVDGVMYARTRDRYALAHAELANIAGHVAFRTGPLLGA